MSFAVVSGLALRLTKSDSCGKPIQGPANRIVTGGFIRINLDPNLNQAEEREQKNAAGKVCVTASTPGERKWWNVEAQFCDVDPDIYAMLANWTRILDYDGNPVGMRDRKGVESDLGAIFELWSGVGDDDECDIPTDDSIFTAAGTGKKYGYLSFVGTEFVSSGITVEDAVGTFTLTGRTKAPKRLGRGPYNVVALDDNNTPGRLLVPAYDKDDDNHLVWFSTPIAPPEPTDGACELAIQSIFTGVGNAYYGASAASVAPAQPICHPEVYTVVVGGTGNFKLKVDPGPLSANIAHTALPAAVKTAIENLPNVEVGQVEVTGVAGNYTVKLDPTLGALISDSTGLTGGTAVVTAV